ncbi:MAG: sugar ABC transporter substrate-binding protein, partial [Mesorhizobium sp.]
MGGLAIALAFAMPSHAADKIKVGLITKFPVPFYSTMEEAAKKYAAAHR